MSFIGSKKLALLVFALGVGTFGFSHMAYAGGCGMDMSGTNMAGMDHSGHQMGNSASDAKNSCSEAMKKYSYIANMPIFLDSPEVIYAKGAELGLTSEQITKIAAITKEARRNALAVLTDEQRAKLGPVSDTPITMAKICPMMKAAAESNAAKSAQAGASAVKEQPKTVEQTNCPVMGGEINKEISTTYKGKTVYFCCPGCIDKFNKNPESYIGKLPQFAK